MNKHFIISLLAASAAVFASPLSCAATNIVAVAAQNAETCHHSACVEHQIAPKYFGVPLRGASSTTVNLPAATTRPMFFNPGGLPALHVTTPNHPAPIVDCVYHQHILKPGGQMLRDDPKRGINWRRICRDVHGHGVISPRVG